MNMSQRRIINIFKSFVQRVFVPQLSKMDFACQQEWNKFSNMISTDQLNLGQIQLYVDTLPGINSSMNRQNFDRNQNKSPLFSKLRKQGTNQQANVPFNPSKTFGGQKIRNMFQIKDFEDAQQTSGDRQNYNFSKDFSKQKQDGFSGLSTQAVLPTLEKLFKLFSDNQLKMQKMGFTPLSSNYEHKTYYN